MLGITDPYIWGAYAACILTTAFCIIFGLVKGRTTTAEEEEETDD
jgi:heme exporter protein D